MNKMHTIQDVKQRIHELIQKRYWYQWSSIWTLRLISWIIWL